MEAACSFNAPEQTHYATRHNKSQKTIIWVLDNLILFYKIIYIW